jgi:hypothetical protein
MVRHGPVTLLALAAALCSPAAAHAACAATPLAAQAASTPVIVMATALPGATGRGGVGLLSPATFRVTRYEKGSGPGTIRVGTALSKLADGTVGIGSEGINPLPGQRWLLWGSFDANGIFATSVCAGSHRAFTSILTPQLRSSSGRVLGTLRRSAYDPAAIPGKAVTVRRGRPLTLTTGVAAPVDRGQDALRLSAGLRAKVNGRWQALDVSWQAGPEGQIAVRLKTVPAHTTALLLLTPSGFFAASLRAG